MSVENQIAEATKLEESGNFPDAIQILSSITFESTQRTFSDELKMQVYLKAAELCIKLENIPDAEVQVTKASMLQASVHDDDLLTKYKSLYAIVLDRNSRFAEASTRYYELSLKPALTPSEKLEVLQHAVTCTLLAPPGSPKNRMLKNVYKDDRCHQLVGYSLIKNMHLERMIKSAELTNFEAILRPHQRQVDDDGTSTLQRAILEHNILALSRLYKCITFESMSQLLGIPPDHVERTITRLITTNCVVGTVDQIESLVTFDQDADVDRWNNYVLSVCDQTNRVNELIAKKYPTWHTEQVKSVVLDAGAPMSV